MANNKIFSLGSLVSGGTCGKVFCKFKVRLLHILGSTSIMA